MAKKNNPALTIDMLLYNDCGNPDNFDEWQEHQEKFKGSDEYHPYTGVMRYNISLHCVSFVVRARTLEDGTHEILDYIVQHH